jgi:hypothetical protein
MVINEDNIECAHDSVLLDESLLMKWQIICKLVMVLPMKSFITDFGFIKFVHKQKHLDICQQHLNHYGNEYETFFDRIVTGYGTQIHHYELENKWQSMQWIHLQSPRKRKFKSQPSKEN